MRIQITLDLPEGHPWTQELPDLLAITDDAGTEINGHVPLVLAARDGWRRDVALYEAEVSE